MSKLINCRTCGNLVPSSNLFLGDCKKCRAEKEHRKTETEKQERHRQQMKENQNKENRKREDNDRKLRDEDRKLRMEAVYQADEQRRIAEKAIEENNLREQQKKFNQNKYFISMCNDSNIDDLKSILSSGTVSVDADSIESSEIFLNPLCVSIKSEQMKAALFLIERGADMQLAIKIAINSFDRKIVDELIKYGTEIPRNWLYQKALNIVKYKSSTNIQFFEDLGIDIKKVNDQIEDERKRAEEQAIKIEKEKEAERRLAEEQNAIRKKEEEESVRSELLIQIKIKRIERIKKIVIFCIYLLISILIPLVIYFVFKSNFEIPFIAVIKDLLSHSTDMTKNLNFNYLGTLPFFIALNFSVIILTRLIFLVLRKSFTIKNQVISFILVPIIFSIIEYFLLWIIGIISLLVGAVVGIIAMIITRNEKSDLIFANTMLISALILVILMYCIYIFICFKKKEI